MTTRTLNPTLETPEGRAARVAEIVDGMKAEDILALDLRGISGFCDFFVIATVNSPAQMRAIIRRVYETLKSEGLQSFAPPEDESPRWSILDYGDVILHLFDPEARNLYQLDRVWGDAEDFPWRTRLSA